VNTGWPAPHRIQQRSRLHQIVSLEALRELSVSLRQQIMGCIDFLSRSCQTQEADRRPQLKRFRFLRHRNRIRSFEEFFAFINANIRLALVSVVTYGTR